jgi:hypothetical protein
MWPASPRGSRPAAAQEFEYHDLVGGPGFEPGARTLSVGSLYSERAHQQARKGTLARLGRGQRRGQTRV